MSQEIELTLFKSIDTASRDAEEIEALVADALGVRQSIEETLRQVDFGRGGTLLVGGKINGRLATMNIFMPQTFTSAGEKLIGFQSGFSATGTAYRGQGLWPKLLAASETILAAEGAKLIFGYPNPISHPLFSKKLGYRTIPMRKAYIPAIMTSLYGARKLPNYITPALAETIPWKQRVKGKALMTFAEGDQLGFGLLKERRGIRLLEIGGFDPGSDTIGSCLTKMCKAAGTKVCTIEATSGSQFLPSFSFQRPTRPFIFKPIDPAFQDRPWDAFSGLADVFE